MPIKTETVTTATTTLSDDEILAHLHAEAGALARGPRLVAGDVVDIDDKGALERAMVLRPFGVVVAYDPIDDISRVLVVNLAGAEMALTFRGDQVAKR